MYYARGTVLPVSKTKTEGEKQMETKTTKQRTTFVKFAAPDTGRENVGDQVFAWGRVTDMVTMDNGSHYVVEVVTRDNWTMDNHPSTGPDNGEMFYVHWQNIVDGKTIDL
jgi:hypothetical protein